MEVSFLVVFLAAFLAYFDSVKVCAYREEVSTANWQRWIAVEAAKGPLTLSVQMVTNDSVTSVISVISVWQVGIVWIQPREYSNTTS